MEKIKFFRGSKQNLVNERNDGFLYVCDDTGEIFLGEKQLADVNIRTGDGTVSIVQKVCDGEYENIGNGNGGVTFGFGHTNNGDHTVLFGQNCEAGELAKRALCGGKESKTNAKYTAVVGRSLEGNADYVALFGNGNVGNGSASFIAGTYSETTGIAAGSIGSYNNVDSTAGVALGSHNYIGTAAHSSVAAGSGLTSNYANQFVAGQCNNNSASRVAEFGNGEDKNHPSNAFEIYKDGHAEVGRSTRTTDSNRTVITKDFLNIDTVKFTTPTVKVVHDNNSVSGAPTFADEKYVTLVPDKPYELTSTMYGGKYTITYNSGGAYVDRYLKIYSGNTLLYHFGYDEKNSNYSKIAEGTSFDVEIPYNNGDITFVTTANSFKIIPNPYASNVAQKFAAVDSALTNTAVTLQQLQQEAKKYTITDVTSLSKLKDGVQTVYDYDISENDWLNADPDKRMDVEVFRQASIYASYDNAGVYDQHMNEFSPGLYQISTELQTVNTFLGDIYIHINWYNEDNEWLLNDDIVIDIHSNSNYGATEFAASTIVSLPSGGDDWRVYFTVGFSTSSSSDALIGGELDSYLSINQLYLQSTSTSSGCSSSKYVECGSYTNDASGYVVSCTSIPLYNGNNYLTDLLPIQFRNDGTEDGYFVSTFTTSQGNLKVYFKRDSNQVKIHRIRFDDTSQLTDKIYILE